MRPKLLFFILTSVLLCVVGIAIAQENLCEAHEAELSTVVATVCSTIGNNEVCYGNYLVNIVSQANMPEPDFNIPGDRADLASVQSLFLSELNEANDTWGIAQMHLLAMSPRGTQDIMLLLFGDVRADNEVEATTSVIVEALISTNIRSTPSTNAVVISSLGAGESIEAVGRLEDSSWIRVRIAETGAVGWVLADLVVPDDNSQSLDLLSVQDSDKPYFGAMQAMSLTTGNNPACGNFETDGLLIQTPAGTARVTLLINEVTIELIPSSSIGATAFVQSNPEDGMSVAMLDGSAIVSTEGGGFFVNTGTTTTILLDNTSTPITPPTIPTVNDPQIEDTLVLLDTIRDTDIPVTIITTGTNTGANGDDAGTNPTGTDSTTGVDTDSTGNTAGNQEECTGPGNSCDAPGQQVGDGCELGGNACDSNSRNRRP